MCDRLTIQFACVQAWCLQKVFVLGVLRLRIMLFGPPWFSHALPVRPLVELLAADGSTGTMLAGIMSFRASIFDLKSACKELPLIYQHTRMQARPAVCG